MGPAELDDSVSHQRVPKTASQDNVRPPEPTLPLFGTPLDINKNNESRAPSVSLSATGKSLDNETARSPPTSHFAANSERNSTSTDARSDEGASTNVSNHTVITQVEEFLASSQKELKDLTRKDDDARETHNANQRKKVRTTGQRYRAFKSELADTINRLGPLTERLNHIIIVLKENEVQQKSRNDKLLKEVVDAKELQEQEREALELKEKRLEQIKKDLELRAQELSERSELGIESLQRFFVSRIGERIVEKGCKINRDGALRTKF
jgi:hypothetical protein